jgi:hypothetical protein
MKFILLSLLIVTFVSCGPVPANDIEPTKDLNVKGLNLTEIEIQGCQYIGNFYTGSGAWGTHKGNCTNVIHSLR